MKFFYSLLIVIISEFFCNDKLDEFILEIEAVLKERKSHLTEQFYKKCSLIPTCPKSYLSCVQPIPPFECSEKYIRTECEKCYDIKGSKVGLKESVVSFTDQLSTPSAAVKEMNCLLATMDEYFIDAMDKYPFGWQYVGTYTSLYRTFPGHYVCNFDPRHRPWYIAGSTGAKNLGIILNTASSMNEKRKDLIQIALVNKMISSLTLNDFFGVVTYSEGYKKVNNTLLRATSKVKGEYPSILSGIPINGKGDFIEAFQNIYTMFHDSVNGDEIGALPKQNLILFIVDVIPKIDYTIKDVVSKIDELEKQYKLNATIITYVIGSDESIVHSVKEISCSRFGFTDLITSSDEISDKLLNFYLILSSGLVRTEVVWTEPYEDASGLGSMTSAVLPFYEEKNSHPNKLLGVIGVDVLLDTILNFTTIEELNKKILSGKKEPQNSLLDFCQLQSLRGKYKCVTDQYCNVTLTEMPECAQEFEPFYERNQILYLGKVGNCCGETKCVLQYAIYIGYIMLALIVITLIVIAVLVLCSKPIQIEKKQVIELKEEESKLK